MKQLRARDMKLNDEKGVKLNNEKNVKLRRRETYMKLKRVRERKCEADRRERERGKKMSS